MRGIYYLLVVPILSLEIFMMAVLSEHVSAIWRSVGNTEHSLTVSSDQTYKQVVQLVADSASLDSSRPLEAYGVVSGIDRKIKTGRYRLAANWSAAQSLEQMAIGPNDPLKAKIVPGLNLEDCAEVLECAGWVKSATRWIEAASSDKVITLIGVSTYEGLIAPDTYFFDKRESPDKVLQTLNQHWLGYILRVAGTSDLNARMKNGLTLYDSIILASIIQKEAASAPQMATASSVFHNRIRKNWPLGSAATLRYAMGDWNGRDHELPVSLKSPFNTNKRPGLPPHPICIPSEAALKAALNPPETKFFFFSGDGEGNLVFNQTHQGHKTSVGKYRKKILAQEARKAVEASAATVNAASQTAAPDLISNN